MRVLFVLVMLANAAVFAIGRGWLGIPPAETGRDPAQLARQFNAEAVRLPQAPR
ncbi:hypothetical protein V8Z80_06355 [Orrella sp. JC864]|uniref:hypothetical protein n=1 Tax=Orrella sp. JC864 TaxID=3120298 RepID=UPI00300BD99B